MDKGIIDVLPPYEDEALVSWIVRMLRLYSGGKLGHYSRIYMKELFGPDSSAWPGLYFQRGLQYFVDHCGLKHTRVFSSEDTILKYMSVLPFYLSFCSQKQIELFKEKYLKMELYVRIEPSIGIRSAQNYLEDKACFKFCPSCLREQGVCYLNREHQVQGNFVCWKHRCVLKRLPYALRWDYIDFISNIENGNHISEVYVTKEDFVIAEKIADMVHVIFQNGFLNSLDTLKYKITCKLYEQEVINEKGQFFDIEEFAASLGAGYVYDEKNLRTHIAIAVGEECNKRINPIIYLFFILRLFGDLDSYYDYRPIEQGCFLLSKSRISINNIEQRRHDIDYYLKDTKGYGDYAILGDTEEDIVIKHLSCGSIYRISKEYTKLRKCRYCKREKTVTESKMEVSYCRYVNTIQYGIMYGKKELQIRLYCNAGRIPGVIRAGNSILIPEDAPYPKDKRVKE